jgi:DNA-binding CsgD family transcriptional regulator/tetratricopeptide (TPR) repeat protein
LIGVRPEGGSDGFRLRGRRSECAALDQLIDAVRHSESRTLVVRGEAGVGKTALLDYAVEAAADLRVLHASGVESEMELPFAALHQLCAPLLDGLDRLPEPQRDALSIVFGLSAGPAPNRFLVALAVLGLVADAAEERPLLCVVDDAQWLDSATAQTVGFVARRLHVEAVGMIIGAREAGTEFHELPELEVKGLRNGDARALLRSVVGFLLDEQVRDRIVVETGGNPLALLELPRGLTATQLAGGFGLIDAQALPSRIETSFLRQVETLPEDARRLLLVAAAEPIGDPLLMWRAAERLGIEAPAAVQAAESEGLLAVRERVTFRHPLVRSALYRSASATDRRAVHLALAEVTDAEVDPDRRAWHLSAAAPGPSEEVAVELERSAGRAQARGGFAAAAAFLQRSVALTHDPARRTGRALAAAQACVQAGAFESAFRQLATAEAGPLDDLGRAHIDLLRAQAAFAQDRGRDAPPLLLRAARTLETLDVRMARDTYLDAWSAALFAGGSSLLEVSQAARTAPRPVEPDRPSDQLLDGFALLFTDGRSAGVPLLERAAIAFAGSDASTGEVLRWGWLATAAAAAVWDFDSCLTSAARQVQAARDAGALAVLAVGVNVLGQAVALAGEFGEAASLMAEAAAVKEATGTHIAPYGGLVLVALRGRETEAFSLIDATIQGAGAEGQGTAVQYARWARSVLLNSLGHYEEALVAATEASDDTPELFVSAWALSERVEAAVRSGNPRQAATALERLVERAEGTDSGWARGLAARARAMAGAGSAAEHGYREAIERLSGTQLRPELARSHLLFGEWLRREGRRVDARAQLRTAHELLTAIGLEAFADRARRELVATGETVRKRRFVTPHELTPQERQIALLARDGLSNPEVGARLFISPRTVEWHLRKVFAKLAITSRKELRGALRGAELELTI